MKKLGPIYLLKHNQNCLSIYHQANMLKILVIFKLAML